MENREAALLAIEHREVYDIRLNRCVWVNKLVYWGDELMILGYAMEAEYKASEYGTSWRLIENPEAEGEFGQWLDECKKITER